MDLSSIENSSFDEEEIKPSSLPVPRKVINHISLLAELSMAVSAISLSVMTFFIPFRYRVSIFPRSFPHIYPDYTSFILYLPDIFLIAALLFWGFSLILQPKKIRLGPLWLTVPIIGITFFAGISILTSVDRLLSLYSLSRLLLLFGLYLLVLNLTHALKLVSIGAGAQLIVQAIIGTAQVLQQHSLGLQDFQELTLDPKWRGVSIVWSRVGTSLRAYGLSDHPNILGGCLALALILLILVYLRVKGRIQILLTGLILLGCTALFLTFSRSAWLGFAAGISLIIIMLILQKKKDQLKDIVLLGIVGLITQAPILWQNATYLGVRLGGSQSFTTPTPENQALDERVLLNQLAYSIFQLHPLSGVGVSAFPTALSQFQPNYPFDLQPPHLVILDVAAETGIFGGVTYLILMITPWVIILRNLRRFPPSFELIGISAALLAISVISLFDYYPWMLEPGRFWSWLVWGLWGRAWINSVERRAYA